MRHPHPYNIIFNHLIDSRWSFVLITRSTVFLVVYVIAWCHNPWPLCNWRNRIEKIFLLILLKYSQKKSSRIRKITGFYNVYEVLQSILRFKTSTRWLHLLKPPPYRWYPPRPYLVFPFQNINSIPVSFYNFQLSLSL
jgi:hypothetical protein